MLLYVFFSIYLIVYYYIFIFYLSYTHLFYCFYHPFLIYANLCYIFICFILFFIRFWCIGFSYLHYYVSYRGLIKAHFISSLEITETLYCDVYAIDWSKCHIVRGQLQIPLLFVAGNLKSTKKISHLHF